MKRWRMSRNRDRKRRLRLHSGVDGFTYVASEFGLAFDGGEEAGYAIMVKISP
jgi:hypothetical protein